MTYDKKIFVTSWPWVHNTSFSLILFIWLSVTPFGNLQKYTHPILVITQAHKELCALISLKWTIFTTINFKLHILPLIQLHYTRSIEGGIGCNLDMHRVVRVTKDTYHQINMHSKRYNLSTLIEKCTQQRWLWMMRYLDMHCLVGWILSVLLYFSRLIVFP